MYRRIQRIHFVGIGGIGMCGLAELLQSQGYRVSGTDLREGPTVRRLRALGVRVEIGHEARHVGDADVVVFSSAVPSDNPELRIAEERKIPVIRRAEMLAEVMRLKDGIAVAGSHGKTTTTSFIAHVLSAAGLDPTAVIGGRVLGTGATQEATGARLGAGDLLVAEADESDGSFLRLAPVIAVITNIDPEHLDHYGSEAALREAFVSFANRIPFWGANILCLDHPGVQAILPELTRRVITYGFSSQADLVAHDLVRDGWGVRFSVRRRNEKLGSVTLALPGRHNVANALTALAVALELDVPFAQAAEALGAFAGIERRFQLKGELAGVRIVDDYGHHPAEVRATLAAARGVHDGRVIVVFQPHRFTRTRDLLGEFATAFHDADRVIVTDVYAAGEAPIPGADASALVEAIRVHGHRDVHHVPDLADVTGVVVPELAAGDLVITLGAGSIVQVGPELIRALEARTA
ncbi:MAG: UDP-N-acetylmuramate--L-alanine ligase [Myxococcales bacterium]|nr:UDP-N-acetylmuramate--L-alanine ligase [Myxococcales bacterium]